MSNWICLCVFLFMNIIFTSIKANVFSSMNVPLSTPFTNSKYLNTDVNTFVIDLCTNLNSLYVNASLLSESITNGLYDGITTEEFYNLASETAAYMCTDHPDYGKLAATIAMKGLHRGVPAKFSECIITLFDDIDPVTGESTTNLSPMLVAKVKKLANIIDEEIQPDRDYDFDYFGIKTLEKSYLMKVRGRIVESPQYLFMRVSLGIHLSNTSDPAQEAAELALALETYRLMSGRWFIHASPTLFQAGTRNAQLSSCFLLGVESDSIEGIYNTLQRCALISKNAGGIGMSVQNIRAKGSPIKGTKGVSNGLVPMLRVFDATARYVDQGGGKRPGAFAIYTEPWHADIFDVLELRKNTGKEEVRARDLFYGLWIPDLFMRRVEADADWTLMCPAICPGLDNVWGQEFETLYTRYEKESRGMRTIRARELWHAILDAQMETGTPYMLFKDACNAKSNQQNLGTVKCSNLCTEIIEYTAPDEVAVCNLASIVLPRFVSPVGADFLPSAGSMVAVYGVGTDKFVFDHDKLRDIVKTVTRNLNKIIDINYYPVPEARTSNLRHRPVGLGVQGLADVFQLMRLPFDSPEARRLNVDIFETIYFAALEASCKLAAADGPYETYTGSPASKDLLQFDLWELQQPGQNSYPRRWDWTALKSRIAQHGLRNSLLVAPMPTASTAQIVGFNECIEPYTSNIYARRVKAGEFIVVNPHLLRDLVQRGLWTKQIRNRILADGGSIYGIEEIPSELREIYRTVWELRQRSLIDMAADRGVYVDQSQSLNAFIPQPDYAKLTSMHFHSWRRGLKTGMYYLRTKPAARAIQFTVDKLTAKEKQKPAPGVSDDDNDDGSDNGHTFGEACISCSG